MSTKRINPHTAYIGPYDINLGKNKMMIINLAICSITFETVCGIIFCLPKKYPLNMLDIEINGRINAIHMIGNVAFGLSKRVVAINLEDNIIASIIKRFNDSTTGITDAIIFLPRSLPLATIVLIAIGRPNWVSDMTSE